jgi:hypothetical protein
LLQPPQPFGKQGTRHVGKTTLKLVEVPYIRKKLTDDEQRPAIG